MDVKLLSGALGAEISGISLKEINKEIFRLYRQNVFTQPRNTLPTKSD